jgi:hypothetical protein
VEFKSKAYIPFSKQELFYGSLLPINKKILRSKINLYTYVLISSAYRSFQESSQSKPVEKSLIFSMDFRKLD